ncbi:Uncharacterised protein [Raoultella terrigena]|uniref:Uncharacterized protein n=1 Tax=Raoultella terrigena TaxID=577 RepID=A0A485BHI3_RAOTE|nr:Uncharacterised protein [Raoultella terrigena]
MSVTDSLLAFSFAALLLTLTPGLDTALHPTNLRRGRR